MWLCIHGSLDIRLSFGGKLRRKFPEERPDFALHCEPAVYNTDVSTSQQYLSYTKIDFPVAIGLCTWLSLRSENFNKIETCRLECFTKDTDEQALEEFKHSFLSALSPDSMLVVQNKGYAGELSGDRTRKLLEFPALLKKIGDETLATEQITVSTLDHYHCALLAMSGWRSVRDPRLVQQWKRLFFDLVSSNLGLDVSAGRHIDEWNVLEHALAWTFEECTQDDIKHRLISKGKTIQFLYLHARAKEHAGMTTEAFVLLSIGAHIDPSDHSLRQNIERLRPGFPRKGLAAMSRFPGLFGASGNIGLRYQSHSAP
jgi:hypothetical protein